MVREGRGEAILTKDKYSKLCTTLWLSNYTYKIFRKFKWLIMVHSDGMKVK